MNKNIFYSILVALTLATALASWVFEFRAVEVAGSSPWTLPIFFFSAYLILLCFCIVVLKDLVLVEITGITTLAMSLFFSFTLTHALFFLIATFLFLGAIRNIRKDLEMNVKISLWKSLHMGRMRIIFAVSFLIASQYYGMVSHMSGPISMPKVDISSFSDKLVGPMLSLMDPSFKSVQTENMTVDQFILQSQKSNEIPMDTESVSNDIIESQIPANATPQQKDAFRQASKQQITGMQDKITASNSNLVLIEGRKQLSGIVGREVSGDEKINQVFSGIIDKKMSDFFQPSVVGGDSRFPLALIFSIVLFLTVWSIGSFIFSLWVLGTMGLFYSCKKAGIISVRTITVEREIIA